MAVGGKSPAVVAVNESYDGSSWTEGPDLNTARWALGGFGTQTAGIVSGGNITAASALTEEFDGSSWVEGPDLATARWYIGTTGTNTAGLGFGGSVPAPAYSALTEQYNNSF